MELKAPVLIVGAGPVGLIAALTLAQHRVNNITVEKEAEAIEWPKMDNANCRSTELLQRLGLAEELCLKGRVTRSPNTVYFRLAASG